MQQTVRTAFSAIRRQSAAMVPYEQAGLQYIRQLSEDSARACSFQIHLGIQVSKNAGGHMLLVNSVDKLSDYAKYSSYDLALVCHLGHNKTSLAISM